AILSGVEPVLTVLSAHAEEIRRETGATCIVSSPSCLSIGNDKLATCKWLENQGLHFPRYAASEDPPSVEELVRQCGYPLMGKPRLGKSSLGVIKIEDRSDLEYVRTKRGYVMQEYLGDPDSEYTAGCFSDRNGQ